MTTTRHRLHRFSWESDPPAIARGPRAPRRDAFKSDVAMSAAIDWPKIFVASSVVGVALWALWKFSQKPSEAARIELPADQTPPPETEAPEKKPPPPEPKKEIVLLGNPVPVSTGKRYRAKLTLSGFESALANESIIRGQFETIGFSQVRVFASPTELPRDWPPAHATGEPKKHWWVEGVWERPSVSFPRPTQVSAVWEA